MSVGCLNGIEIVCMEWYCEGCVLFYMLCVDIDYVILEVKMIYGIIGVKVWVYKGDMFGCNDVLVVEEVVEDKCLCCNVCLGDCCLCCDGEGGVLGVCCGVLCCGVGKFEDGKIGE